MKFQVVLLICLLSAASAENSMLSSKAQMQAKASDAVDSALDVLKGLEQANVEAQKVADAVNRTKEAEMKLEVDELKGLADQHKKIAQQETDNVKYLSNELSVTNANLRWIVARRAEIIRKRATLQEQRCAASMAFVKALKQHSEALVVIKALKADVISVVEAKTGIKYSGFSEIKDNFEKLGQYAHLFNEKAMKEFSELSAKAFTERPDWKDNKRGELKVEDGAYEKDQRDIAHKFIDMITELEKHMVESVANLKENEIRAAYDMIKWMHESEKELIFLEDDQTAKTAYVDKLTILIVAAKAREDRLWSIFFDSMATYNDAVIKREQIRKAYMEEKARRLDENLILEGIIQMFVKQVAVLDGRLRRAVDDVADDGKANKSKGDWTLDKVDGKQERNEAAIRRANRIADKPALG